MTDVRIVELSTIEGPFFDWMLRKIGVATLDEREELASAVRVALGTDALSDGIEILPDPDSVDRRGWWGDLDAELVWGGWPIGCKNWLLTRAKITDAPSAEGSTLQRAKQYTLQALQPFIDKRIATRVDVTATRTDLNRIDVQAIIYRGPNAEIDLRYQLLWEEDAAVEDVPVVVLAGSKKIRIPYRGLVLSGTAPLAIVNYKNVVVPSGNVRLSQVQPSLTQGLVLPPAGNIYLSQVAPSTLIRSTVVPQGNIALSTVAPIKSGGIDAFTKLMLHFEGADASTTFTDSSASAHSVSRFGDAQIDTAQFKFGSASGLFDGSGDYLQLDGSSDFAFGAGDWTIDFWIRFASVATSQFILDGRPNGGNGAYPTIYMQGTFIKLFVNSADQIISSAVSATTWYHIAITRSGTSTKLFINGTQSGSTYTDSTNYSIPSGRPLIGMAADTTSGPLNGWLDEFRVSKGVARWTTTFTSPTGPYF